MGFRLLKSWWMAQALSGLGLGRAFSTRAARVYRRSAAMALLTVSGTSPENFVRAGQLFERLWLTATLRGVALQPITGLTFLLLRLRLAGGEGLNPRQRRILQRLHDDLCALVPRLADSAPAMLVRLGLASAPSGRAPRLPVTRLLVDDGSGV